MTDTSVPEWITALVRETMQSYGNAATDGRLWNINTAMLFAEEAVMRAALCRRVPASGGELNPEALSAAYDAHRAHAADPGRKGSGLEKAIHAYLAAASPIVAAPEGWPTVTDKMVATALSVWSGVAWKAIRDHLETRAQTEPMTAMRAAIEAALAAAPSIPEGKAEPQP